MLYILLHIILSLSRILAYNAQEFNQSEYFALYSLYVSTDGDNWLWQGDEERWNFSDPNPCEPITWKGITCLSNNTNVKYIVLLNSNLNGELPGFLRIHYPYHIFNSKCTSLLLLDGLFSNFTHLQALALKNNELKGSIPSSIRYLSELFYLDLSYNNFPF